MIYMDNSATTRPYHEVIDLMGELMREGFGNPSSLHHLGVQAEQVVRRAREQVARAVSAQPEEIVFTSGGTESDNAAIWAGARKNRREGTRVVTTSIEHPAVTEAVHRLEEEGHPATFLPVNEEGILREEDVSSALSPDAEAVGLISMMHVNNETGALQPIEKVGEIKGKALLHVDMVQSFGKLTIELSGRHRGVDLASFSAHKVHGPKGVGAMFLRTGLHLAPYLVGGGQEKGLRSGTENVPAIAGFGLATEMAYRERKQKNDALWELTQYMRAYFDREIGQVLWNTPMEKEKSAPHILNASFLETRGEVLLHTLEQDDIYVSTGSACSSHKNTASHVLLAMGRSEKEAEGALRFSLSDDTTLEDVKQVCVKTKEAVERFRHLGSFR